jgi:hypothetical protein
MPFPVAALLGCVCHFLQILFQLLLCSFIITANRLITLKRGDRIGTAELLLQMTMYSVNLLFFIVLKRFYIDLYFHVNVALWYVYREWPVTLCQYCKILFLSLFPVGNVAWTCVRVLTVTELCIEIQDDLDIKHCCN